MNPHAHHAQLCWEDGRPRSLTYDDVYFSRDSGLAETRHVFLDGNHLPARFASLAPGACFTIGETGFGTGLNFLCAWALFRACAPATARLDFVSTEKHPLTPADLSRALAVWPTLAPLADALLGQYRALAPGFQRLSFDRGRVTLTLLIGDVLDTLPELGARVDAWFLDGFSPSKNPQMWVQPLFDTMAAHSAPGASFATFTAAGFVRCGLNAAGFAVRKVPGFGSKREMSVGTLLDAPAPLWQAPWFAAPVPVTGRRALVIGAGIAGASAAASLARRGFHVTVLERHAAPAQEASGNPQGVLYLKLSAHPTAQTQLLLASYGYAVRTLASTLKHGQDWSACGVLQLAHDAASAKRQAALAAAFPATLLTPLSPEQASAQAGIAVDSGGLWFADGGWLKPAALVAALLGQDGIHCRYRSALETLETAANAWRARLSDGSTLEADLVVIACANESRRFIPAAQCRLKPIRGQVSLAPASEASRALNTVLCGEGYVAPAADDAHTFGASFQFDTDATATTVAEHAENLAMLATLNPSLYHALGGDTLDPATLGGRAALRASTPDYLPLVGPVADAGAFDNAYAELARDASRQLTAPMPWLPGLYISAGHGSRGMVSAPLAGELIAAQACGETLPLPQSVVRALSPNRFLLRALVRRER